MKFIVLGSSGFVGRHIAEALEGSGYDVKRLHRPVFDICNEQTYPVLDGSDFCVVDCVTSIDGSPEQVNAVICDGFKKYLDFLKKHHQKFTYLYFSTIATQMPAVAETNVYVAAKLNAENFLRDSGVNYRIIRLTFPFGVGEQKNRLISRLIRKLLSNDDLIIDELRFNLTPIECLQQNFISLINENWTELNLSDGVSHSLIDIVTYLKTKIGSSSEIQSSGKQLDLSIPATPGVFSCYDKVYPTLDKMCNHG